MILFDGPRAAGFRRFQRTAHCMSDVVGDAGTIELLAFARRIGLKPQWLQKRGTPTEHFDLFDGAIDRARDAGAAEVTGRDLIERVVKPKRAARRS